MATTGVMRPGHVCLSVGNLSWGVVQTSPGISQRVLLSLQPPCMGTRTPHAPTQRLSDPLSGQTENGLEARFIIDSLCGRRASFF